MFLLRLFMIPVSMLTSNGWHAWRTYYTERSFHTSATFYQSLALGVPLSHTYRHTSVSFRKFSSIQLTVDEGESPEIFAPSQLDHLFIPDIIYAPQLTDTPTSALQGPTDSTTNFLPPPLHRLSCSSFPYSTPIEALGWRLRDQSPLEHETLNSRRRLIAHWWTRGKCRGENEKSAGILPRRVCLYGLVED